MEEEKYYQKFREIVVEQSDRLHKLVHDEIAPLKKEMRGFWNFMVEMKEQLTVLQDDTLQLKIQLDSFSDKPQCSGIGEG